MSRFLVAVGLLVGLSAPLAAQNPPPARADSFPRVSTTGIGESQITPDRATLFIGVSTRAATAAQASAENSAKQRAVIDTLRAMGIPPARTTTANYSIAPEENYNPQRGDSMPKVVAYRVTNTVRVEVRRLEQIGALIDAAIAQGANGINSLQFYSSKPDSARRAALRDAVASARADAEAIACAAGAALGQLEEVSTESAGLPGPVPMYSMAARAAATTPIEPGEMTIHATIVARWSLIPGAKSCSSR